MTTSLLGIFGAKGHGRDVLLFASQYGYDDIVFVDDDCSFGESCGLSVYSIEEFLSIQADDRAIVVAVSNGYLREQITKRILAAGITVGSLIAPSAQIAVATVFGVGSLVSPNVVISSNVSIGDGFQCNTNSSIAHDCVIGNYVTFAPGVLCNGAVHIGDYCYVGAGATIRQGTATEPRRIGNGAVIGMGAVVLEDVMDGQTVVGNPAKELNRIGVEC